MVYLLGECPDFKYEQSALEKLLHDLSEGQAFTVSMMTTPKYHCEIAGEGIEYDWGVAKKTYRNKPLKDKRSRDDFLRTLNASLSRVDVTLARKMSAKARRYMLTYTLYDSGAHPEAFNERGLSYSDIEKQTKLMRVHRSAVDQDHGYISRIWKESLKTNQ